jgi:hypothetical protein
MVVPTTGGSIWPARLAYAAALVFTGASAGTNAIYGWQRGADLAGSLIWLSVSIAASIVFALSIPALLQSISARKVAHSLLVLVGLVVCGTYSIVAALGSASGGRVDAAAGEQAAVDARRKAQAAYDKAATDLAALKPTRPVAELEALLGAPVPCRVLVTPGSRQTVCGHPAALTSEMGRAKRRAELEAKIEAARVELSAPTTRQANSDAAALVGYLGALGWPVEGDTLNKALALLAVLVVELGGGASLAIGMALGEVGVRPGRTVTERSLTERPNDRVNERPERAFELASPINGRSGPLNERPERSAHDRVLSALRASDGVLFGSQGALGRSFGWSKTRMNEVLHQLEDTGWVRLSVSRQGTMVRLSAVQPPSFS